MGESQRNANLGIPPDLERQDPLEYEKRVRETRERLEKGLIEDDTPGAIKGGPPRERRSMTRILGYKLREECDLCLRVLNGQDDLSLAVALSLYHAYARDCREHQVRRVVFRPNLTYEFSNGLVFRLFLEPAGPPEIYLPLEPVVGSGVVEFYVPPERAAHRRAILLTVPSLLEQAGYEDESLLMALRQFLHNDAAVALDTSRAAPRPFPEG